MNHQLLFRTRTLPLPARLELCLFKLTPDHRNISANNSGCLKSLRDHPIANQRPSQRLNRPSASAPTDVLTLPKLKKFGPALQHRHRTALPLPLRTALGHRLRTVLSHQPQTVRQLRVRARRPGLTTLLLIPTAPLLQPTLILTRRRTQLRLLHLRGLRPSRARPGARSHMATQLALPLLRMTQQPDGV